MTFSGSRVGRREASPPPPAQVGWAGLRGLPKRDSACWEPWLGKGKREGLPATLVSQEMTSTMGHGLMSGR